MFRLVFSILLGKSIRASLLKLFKKYRAVIRFILTFLGTYAGLVLIYDLYLDHYFSQGLPDPVTRLVGEQTEAFVNSFGYDAMAAPSSMYPLMNLSVNDIFIARIIEGCNSVSLIILFLAFMLAFIGKLKPTLLYILAGMVIIYSINVVRIGLLAIGLYEMPQHSHFLHTIAFPLVIYGTVFLLWIFWILIYTKSLRK